MGRRLRGLAVRAPGRLPAKSSTCCTSYYLRVNGVGNGENHQKSNGWRRAPELIWPIETNWEERYRTGDMPWEKGEPSPGLVDFLAAHPELRRGTVCVPGCGSGHDVRAWARAGFEAHGFDLAPSAIRLSIERSKGIPNAHFTIANFLEDSPPMLFDWLFEHTLYCAIDPARREEYADAVMRWLKPDGQLLAVHYLIPDEEGPPFGTTRDEVVNRFSSKLRLVEDWVPRSYPNRTGLERIFWWRRP